MNATLEAPPKQDILTMLDPLRFKTEVETLYRHGLIIAKVRAIVNADTNKDIAYVSDKYKLLPYSDNLIPAVESLVKQGWEAPPFANGRRPAVRAESDGRRAFVELWHPNVISVNGEQLRPRMVLRNSYDAQSVLGAWAGAGVVICVNGMYSYKEVLSFIGHRHVGSDTKENDRMLKMADTFLDSFETSMEFAKQLQAVTPGEEGAMKAIHEVAVRSDQTIMDRVRGEFLDQASGWDVFQAITNWLTFDFKGSERLSRIKQKNAVGVLLS